jgi:hypothetical protein
MEREPSEKLTIGYVWRMFRRRFSDLIDRQLDLFARDHHDEIEEAVTLLDRHRTADRADAEESFGDYRDRVDWLAQDLATLRDTYAETLEEGTASAYRKAFGKATRRRFPPLARALDDEDW